MRKCKECKFVNRVCKLTLSELTYDQSGEATGCNKFKRQKREARQQDEND